MALKKGIVVRDGTTDVHKLDDQGEFNLGLAGSGHAIKLNGTVTIEGVDGTDVAAAVADIATDVGNEETLDTNVLQDMQTKLDAIQEKLGTDADGNMVAYAAGICFGATTFKAADENLDTAIGDIETRVSNIQGNMHANSIKKQIAAVVFGDGFTATAESITNAEGTALGAGALDTIKEIQVAMTDAAITPTAVKQQLIAYIASSKADLLLETEGATTTFGALSSSLAGEISRYVIKHNDMDGELTTTLGNSSLKADGTKDWDFSSTNYIAGAEITTLKLADETLDSALNSRKATMDGWEAGLSVTTLAARGDVEFQDSVTFGAGARFTLPRMNASQATAAGLEDTTDLANGVHDGKFVYIATAATVGSFQQANKLYMCEDGVWHASAFINE